VRRFLLVGLTGSIATGKSTVSRMFAHLGARVLDADLLAREVVMPGMTRLLHRPAYDFTRTYAYNREQFAFGCYHCHKVK